jgi:para-aminobenzoate synthetase component 1
LTTSYTPLFQEIIYQDPIKIFSFLQQNEWSIFFDSANHQQPFQKTNQYSYIALLPFRTITLKNNVIAEDHSKIIDPFDLLKKCLRSFNIQKIPGLPPFQGGLAGYFAYDLCRYIEKLPHPILDDMNFPDLAIGFYDCVISFDHNDKRAWIVSTGFPETEESLRQQRAKSRLAELLVRLKKNPESKSDKKVIIQTVCNATDITSNFNKKKYLETVKIAQNYICCGDIFEVNLSQRFKAQLPQGLVPFALYKRLRKINPSPFAAYINLGKITIASASPERFIFLQDGNVETRPIKGTMQRGKTREEDRLLSEQLLQSEKDCAENVMIVDLMRNDLSRVCKDDSILVEKLCGLESYATVHHLVSVIKGKLRPEHDAIDLLKSTFPGGSITGAPKIRAMEIISELEPHCRGPYCGSIAFISFSGDMDTSIIIRTYLINDGTVTYQVGGAVVFDSDPMQEYDETLIKAHALNRALLEDIDERGELYKIAAINQEEKTDYFSEGL